MYLLLCYFDYPNLELLNPITTTLQQHPNLGLQTLILSPCFVLCCPNRIGQYTCSLNGNSSFFHCTAVEIPCYQTTINIAI